MKVMSQRIRVVCRKRPMNRKEVHSQHQNVVACSSGAVLIREPKLKVDLTKYIEEHTFQFDNAFDESVSNDQLYAECVCPLVDCFISTHAKCTCFAYGQTGSGKTFTMLGSGLVQGIFPLSVFDIFSRIGDDMCVVVSFYEIYCGKLFDLLNGRKHLHARENAHGKVIIQGIREIEAESAAKLMAEISVGLSSRTTGVTGANVDSSRSHAIIQISLKRRRNTKLIDTGARLSFIDLAGSERGADTVDQDRQTRIDGAEINKSLLALKECIRALDLQHEHTPFRGSKLTQVLKDSFIGANCMTLMIANVSPSSISVEHSLNTLRYAYRVKELRPPIVSTDVPLSRCSSSLSEKENSSLSDEQVVATNEYVPKRRESLAREHDRLIGVILSEEENLISVHRKSLETFVQMLNEEMKQVNLIDQPGSDVDSYVRYMDENLASKEMLILNLRNQLAKFKQHLKQEEILSREMMGLGA